MASIASRCENGLLRFGRASSSMRSGSGVCAMLGKLAKDQLHMATSLYNDSRCRYVVPQYEDRLYVISLPTLCALTFARVCEESLIARFTQKHLHTHEHDGPVQINFY